MNTHEIKILKSKIELIPRQRELMVGLLLGDGHLETQNQGRTYRLKIEHSWRQKEYVDWLWGEFQTLTRTPPQQKMQTVNGELYKKYWFNTLSISPFRFYAQQFYQNGKKIVPKQIDRWLTPLALAIWYMDDGSIKSKAHKTVFLNTQGFDKGSIQRLQGALEKKFGIKTCLRKQTDGVQIYVLSETVDIFRECIGPWIHPSMRYKLPKQWLT